jgi:predicted RNase H-like HicB family nuclease
MARQPFTYTVIYQHDPETGAVCATVPALDLGTYGRTMEEARAMIQEALELHLEGLLEENMHVPGDIVAIERLTVDVTSGASSDHSGDQCSSSI